MKKNTKGSIIKKQQILKDLKESMIFVKLHQQGKVKAKTIEQLLNEI